MGFKIASGKWTLWLFIAMAVVAIAGIATGLAIHYGDGPGRLGGNPTLMERPGRDGKTVTLHQSPSVRLVIDNDVDTKIAQEAIEWWTKRTTYNISWGREDQDVWDHIGTDYPLLGGNFFVTVEAVPESEKCGGITDLRYNLDTGLIYTGTIKINHAYAYDKQTYLKAMIHEIGHVLGLEDDPLPGIDLNSIMRVTLNPTGVLTEEDRTALEAQHGKRN